MKRTLLLITFILTSFNGLGQCPNEILILATQSQIDNFSINYPGCTELQNNLWIGTNSGSNITNLNGLSQITAVVGSQIGLFIIGSPLLENLSGLENLEFIDGPFGVQNTGISNFSGLGNLERIGGVFSVRANYNLINFDGLPSLTTITGGLQADENTSLINFEGLGSIETIGSSGSTGNILIYSNPSLQNLDGLEGWQFVRNFSILDNQNINSIDGAANITLHSTTIIWIEDNPNLSFCAITLVCESFNDSNISHLIANNSPGCNNPQEVEAACLLFISDFDLKKAIVLFPNPVSSILQIETREGIVLQKAVVYSILGEELILTSEKTVDFSTFSAGIYFVEIVTNRGSVTKKIVKK